MSDSLKNILPVLMIAASVWALIGYLRPKYSDIQVLKMEKQGYQQALDNANEVRIRRGRLLETYNSFSVADREKLAKMLPLEGDGVRGLRDMFGIAKIFDIKLEGVSLEKAEGAAQTSSVQMAPPTGGTGDVFPSTFQTAPALTSKALTMSFGFTTDYANFLRFLRELERNLELTDVNSISISRSASAEGDGLVSSSPLYGFQMTVQTYWVE
ncbi:MAG TPA: hypothetical protein VJH94_04920 [Candidatus Paceibacterota bacterium]